MADRQKVESNLKEIEQCLWSDVNIKAEQWRLQETETKWYCHSRYRILDENGKQIKVIDFSLSIDKETEGDEPEIEVKFWGKYDKPLAQEYGLAEKIKAIIPQKLRKLKVVKK